MSWNQVYDFNWKTMDFTWVWVPATWVQVPIWGKQFQNPYYKTSHYYLQVGTHNFEGIKSLYLPLSDEAVKVLFSTSPKTVSEI